MSPQDMMRLPAGTGAGVGLTLGAALGLLVFDDFAWIVGSGLALGALVDLNRWAHTG